MIYFFSLIKKLEPELRRIGEKFLHELSQDDLEIGQIMAVLQQADVTADLCGLS
jgi:hypothetical protein